MAKDIYVYSVTWALVWLGTNVRWGLGCGQHSCLSEDVCLGNLAWPFGSDASSSSIWNEFFVESFWATQKEFTTAEMFLAELFGKVIFGGWCWRWDCGFLRRDSVNKGERAMRHLPNWKSLFEKQNCRAEVGWKECQQAAGNNPRAAFSLSPTQRPLPARTPHTSFAAIGNPSWDIPTMKSSLYRSLSVSHTLTAGLHDLAIHPVWTWTAIRLHLEVLKDVMGWYVLSPSTTRGRCTTKHERLNAFHQFLSSLTSLLMFFQLSDHAQAS